MPQSSTLATISRMEIGTNNLISENIVRYLNNGPNYRLVGELNYFRHIKHLLFKHWIRIFSLKVLNAQPQHYFFFHFDSQIGREFWAMGNESGAAVQNTGVSIDCSLKGPVMASLKYFIMKKMEKGSLFFPHGDNIQIWTTPASRSLISQYKAECCRYDEFSTYLRLFWM